MEDNSESRPAFFKTNSEYVASFKFLKKILSVKNLKSLQFKIKTEKL